MPANVIVGFDGTDTARDALALGLALIATGAVERLTLANVYHDDPFLGTGRVVHEGALIREATATLEQAASELEIEVDRRTVGAASPAGGLHALAAHEEADLVVVGSSGKGPHGRILAGGVADGLLHGCPCAVAIAPAGFAGRPGRDIQVIGVAYDGSKQARHALVEATALAQIAHASVRLIVVVRPATDEAVRAVSSVGFSVATYAHGRHLKAQAKLDDAIASLPASVDATGLLVEGDVAEALAAQEVDLLLCGSRAYGAGGNVMLGSTSRPLVSRALAPVIVIPQAATRPLFSATAGEVGSGDVR